MGIVRWSRRTEGHIEAADLAGLEPRLRGADQSAATAGANRDQCRRRKTAQGEAPSVARQRLIDDRPHSDGGGSGSQNLTPFGEHGCTARRCAAAVADDAKDDRERGTRRRHGAQSPRECSTTRHRKIDDLFFTAAERQLVRRWIEKKSVQ